MTFDNNTGVEIICDENLINNIIDNNKLSIYPHINKKILKTMTVYWMDSRYYIRGSQTNISSDLGRIYREDIVIYCNCGSDNPRSIFKIININKNVIDEYTTRLNNIPKPYMTIHIRNTDYKCNYKKLYDDNKDRIHNEKNVYIATDDINTLNFFKSKRTVHNFTTFPSGGGYANLHYNKDISSNTRFMDTLCDLFILGSSRDILTISKGGYIKLGRELCYNKFLLYSLLK